MTSTTARLNQTLVRPQLIPNDDTGIRHFIGVEGLTRPQLEGIIDKAMGYFDEDGKLINTTELSGKTVMNLFFENSTRTRTTFEAAQKRLGANVLNLDIARSSTNKGETLRDTLWNLEAMSADMFVVRHSASGAAHYMATEVPPMSPSSTQATAGTPTPRKRCLTCSPFTVKQISPLMNFLWRLLAISSTAVWLVRTFRL